MPPGSSPVCLRAAGMLSLVLPPPQTPPSAPSAPERRGGEEEALRGCCWHSQLHQDPIPTPRVCSRAGAAAEEQPWPQRSRGGEMLTCSAVSPLLGPSSPSDSVSLTTPRAASSPASLPSRREQCRREQLAAEPTPLREAGREAAPRPAPAPVLSAPSGQDPAVPAASAHGSTAARLLRAAQLLWVQGCPSTG